MSGTLRGRVERLWGKRPPRVEPAVFLALPGADQHRLATYGRVAESWDDAELQHVIDAMRARIERSRDHAETH
jgi:hypothetical protein